MCWGWSCCFRAGRGYARDLELLLHPTHKRARGMPTCDLLEGMGEQGALQFLSAFGVPQE